MNAAFPICPGQDGPVADRFLKYVQPSDINKCWEWTGGRNRKGYGVFALTHFHQVRASRLSFRLYNGRNPSGLVLHLCDNPPCVNPLHLQDGTHKENMQQMAQRKRAARQELHHKAKFKAETVIAVIALHRSGDYSTRELAAMFHVDQSTIAAIITGRYWPDVYALADAMLAARKRPVSA